MIAINNCFDGRLTTKKILVAMFCIISAMGCVAKKMEKTLIHERLMKANNGSVVKISNILQEEASAACVLHPYQNRVSDSVDGHFAINKHLEDVGYQASESDWSLVVLSKDSVSHYTFNRSKDLDLFSSSDLSALSLVGLPSNFVAAECVKFDRAAFFKTSIRNRIYLIFGGVR